MKKLILPLLHTLLLFFLFILLLLLLIPYDKKDCTMDKEIDFIDTVPTEKQPLPVPNTPKCERKGIISENITINVIDENGQVRCEDLEAYTLQVLLGEMPAEFQQEALMAQAVAARTFAYKCKMSGQKHKNGDVCSNSSCCQACISEESYIKNGGT